MAELTVGGIVVALAAFLGGVTGFGYGLVATPLLLLAGFSLPFVVTVNLALALVTRVSVAVRFRAHLDRRRAALLVAGSAPGLLLGARALAVVDARTIKVLAGSCVVVLAGALLAQRRAETPRRLPAGELAAGFAGGFLGTTTSLNGIVPVLLLARERVAAATFIADLAVYFVCSNALGLTLLALNGTLSTRALFPALVVWLPGSIAANLVGSALGPRLPARAFRLLTLGVAIVAGAITVASASS